MNSFGTALVAGATGFIGRALVTRLSAEGVTTICLVRPNSSGRKQIEKLSNLKILNVQDYAGAGLAEQLGEFKPDVVFNLASAGVSPSVQDPMQLLSGNLVAATALLNGVAALHSTRFIHVGSCSEYGQAAENRLVTELDCLRPLSLYGAAKACSYIFGHVLATQLEIPFITLRFFGVFGLGEADYRLVPYLIRNLRRDAPVDLTGGEQVRDLIYIDDAIEALLTAANAKHLKPGGAYNVCSGKAVKVRQVAECVAEVMGKPKDLLRFGERPYRQDEPMWLVGDNQSFITQTDWKPKIDLREGIRRMASSEVYDRTH